MNRVSSWCWRVRVSAGVVAIALFALVVSCRRADAGPLLAPKQDCSEPTYEPDGRAWAQLPPAAVALSSDGCVGYCFNAVIESESEENGRMARVVVLDQGGAQTRGIVDRSRVLTNAALAARAGEAVRFACFERFDEGGPAPRFDDCVQMLASKEKDPGCDTTREAAVDARRSIR